MPSKTASSTASDRFPILVFSDGASSGNPGPGGWGSIVVVPDGAVTELGGSDPSTTNNRMELMGTIKALEFLATRFSNGLEATPIAVHTDSTYVIRGITQWIWGWLKKGWKSAEGNEVANQDLWKRLLGVVTELKKRAPLEWRYVRGHAGIPGNERVDEIAVSFSKSYRLDLYRGPLLGYSVPIHDLPEKFDLPEMKAPAAPKASAYSYLSVLNNVPMRHRNWGECEARVKGRSGARFKKALSETDEKEILASWGFGLKDVKEEKSR